MSATYKHPRPAVTVDAMVVTNEDNPAVLLIKRKNPPYQDHWALPGGFLDLDEDLDHAVARELEEETGLQGIPFQQIGAFGKAKRDPREHVVSIAYLGIVNRDDHTPVANDDAKEAAWFPLHALPPLAFDHAEVIAQGEPLYRQSISA